MGVHHLDPSGAQQPGQSANRQRPGGACAPVEGKRLEPQLPRCRLQGPLAVQRSQHDLDARPSQRHREVEQQVVVGVVVDEVENPHPLALAAAFAGTSTSSAG